MSVSASAVSSSSAVPGGVDTGTPPVTDSESSTSSYPPYSGTKATCTKCGGGMDEKYMPAGTAFVAVADGGCMYRYGTGPEWLYRECFSCGFGWPERCRDAGTVVVGQILGDLPPEPPIGTVLATQAWPGQPWEPVIERRDDGWHLYGYENDDPKDWRYEFQAFRPLQVVFTP